MAFSVKQREYFMQATRRWNFKSGATRSGKTYMDYFVIPKRIRSRAGDPGHIMLIGNTQATLERNIFAPMREIYGKELVGSVNQKNEIKLFGSTAYALGADKQTSVDKIRGSSVKYCYGDEVTTWARPVFDMLKSRLDKPNSCFDGTCNPDNPNHWLKAFLDSDADIYQQHYNIDDNPFLTSEFVAELKKEYAGQIYYNRYILGQWTLAEGLVYDNFNETIHIVPTIERRYRQYYVSVDYGTQNATTFGLWGDYAGAWYKIREYYYSGRDKNKQKTDSEFADDMENFVRGLRLGAIIVDPSAASFRAELRKRGFTVINGRNDVIDGIRNHASLLEQGRIFYNDCCKETIKEFGAYRWDEKAALRGEDKPIKESDHCLTGDTVVNTVHGDFTIQNLVGKVGQVYCYDEIKGEATTSIFYDVRKTQENVDVYLLELEDGRTIKATANHRVLTVEGWKELGQLTEEDEVIDIGGCYG